MPCPENVTLGNGHFAFKQQVNIYIEGMSDHANKPLYLVSMQLKRLENFDFKQFNVVSNKAKADLVIVS